MNDVSMFVDHDVAVVSVFDLKKVAHQRIGSHTLYEVSTGLQGCAYARDESESLEGRVRRRGLAGAKI